jgi:hypothetical protein
MGKKNCNRKRGGDGAVNIRSRVHAETMKTFDVFIVIEKVFVAPSPLVSNRFPVYEIFIVMHEVESFFLIVPKGERGVRL